MNRILHPITTQRTEVLPLWRISDPGARAELERTFRTHRRRYRAGTLIGLEDTEADVTYCMLAGWVSLSKSMPDGQRQTIDFSLPGDILSQISPHIATSALQMETVTSATIAVIPGPTWARLGKAFPQLEKLENHRAFEALSRLSDRMLRLGKGSAETRIAHALIELCTRLYAIGQSSGLGLHLPLTQQQLGEFVGLSSVHVCRTLGRLSRHGVITVRDHMDILINDMGALAQIAGVDGTFLPERYH